MWESYGFRSFYSPEEAEIIVNELEDQGFEVKVYKRLIKKQGQSLINCPIESKNPYYECEIRYKTSIFSKDKPKASIE